MKSNSDYSNLYTAIIDCKTVKELISKFEMIKNSGEFENSIFLSMVNEFIVELHTRALSIELPEFNELWDNDPTNIYLLKKKLLNLVNLGQKLPEIYTLKSYEHGRGKRK
jgi:hypothetical protein